MSLQSRTFPSPGVWNFRFVSTLGPPANIAREETAWPSVLAQVARAERRLRMAGVAEPRSDALALAAHVWQRTGRRGRPGDAARTEDQTLTYHRLIEQRCRRVPLEHLTGVAHFRGLELLVGPGVFIPQPETSCVVQWAVDALRQCVAAGEPEPLCVDLCTGSGTIALAIASEVPEAKVLAIDLDSEALMWAERNARRHNLDVAFHHGDVAAAFPELGGQLDLVVSNPPYVATGELDLVKPEVRDHDPVVALHAGDEGLDLIRAVEATARRLLKPGRPVIVEHSDRQGLTAPAIFQAGEAWTSVEDHPDCDQLDRFVTAVRI